MKKFPLLFTFLLALQAAPALAAGSDGGGLALDARVATQPEAKAPKVDVKSEEDDDDDGDDGPGDAVAIVVPLAFFLSFVAVVGGAFYTRFRIERQKHETLRLIVEKGGVIPPELLVPPIPRNRDLRRGVLLSCVGLGTGVFFSLTGPQGIGLGVIPLLVGLGYLLIWKLVFTPRLMLAPWLSPFNLIARVLVADDRHAFGELVRRHQSQVRALLGKLTCGNRDLADDLAQEAFLRAYRGLKGYRGTAKLSTWLCQIAYNVFLTEADRAKGRAEAPEQRGERAAVAESKESSALFRRDLEVAMADLNEEERAAIAVAFGQDLSHDEAAAILGCPLGTLKSRINRGLEKLERRMESWRSATHV